MSDRPIVFAADGFEIIAHESAPALYPATVGTSPHDYVTRRRLNRARTLLCTTSRSVTEIAAEVGMSHSHLSRVFARRLGVTPTEFRRINRR